MDWYEPGEDTYTFIDLLEEERIRDKVVVDLGCSTDHNLLALQQIREKNVVRTDLLAGIRQDRIDVCVFNPPYVPNYDCKILGGGKDGREVIDRFIASVTIKTVYLLIIEANKPLEVKKLLEKRNYSVSVVKIRKVLGEVIIILKCIRR